MEISEGDCISIHCNCGKKVSEFEVNADFITSQEIDVKHAKSKGYLVMRNADVSHTQKTLMPCLDRINCVFARYYNAVHGKMSIFKE